MPRRHITQSQAAASFSRPQTNRSDDYQSNDQNTGTCVISCPGRTCWICRFFLHGRINKTTAVTNLAKWSHFSSQINSSCPAEDQRPWYWRMLRNCNWNENIFLCYVGPQPDVSQGTVTENSFHKVLLLIFLVMTNLSSLSRASKF